MQETAGHAILPASASAGEQHEVAPSPATATPITGKRTDATGTACLYEAVSQEEKLGKLQKSRGTQRCKKLAEESSHEPGGVGTGSAGSPQYTLGQLSRATKCGKP